MTTIAEPLARASKSAAPHVAKVPTRIAELDVLRFIAAASVVVYHFTYRPMRHGAVDEQLFGGLQAVSRFGYLGVSLFFMISGFVILWSSQARSAGEFVISRIARLYPSFWTAVALTTIVLAVGGVERISPKTFALNLTMIPGALGVGYVDGVYWTLFVELKFYFLVFLILITGSMNRVETWLAVWLAACVVAATGFAPHGLGSLALYPYGPYFISGCLLYLLRSRGSSAPRLAMLAVSCVLAARYAIQQQPDFFQNPTPATGWIVASTIVAFHLVFLAVALVPNMLPPSRWAYVIGSLTYPLYLLHNRIGKTLVAHLPGAWSPWLSLAVVSIAILVLSQIVAVIVERRACSSFNRALLRAWDRVRVRSVSAA